jgi:glucokinase
MHLKRGATEYTNKVQHNNVQQQSTTTKYNTTKYNTTSTTQQSTPQQSTTQQIQHSNDITKKKKHFWIRFTNRHPVFSWHLIHQILGFPFLAVPHDHVIKMRHASPQQLLSSSFTTTLSLAFEEEEEEGEG